METNSIIIILLLIIILIILILYIISLNKMKRLIQKNNENLLYLINELDDDLESENNFQEQQTSLEDEQFIDKKYTSNLNQITSFSQLNHDVRTQLNGIIAFSNMLETEFITSENKELKEYATSIRISGENLLKLFS